jgi:hypothetical protein
LVTFLLEEAMPPIIAPHGTIVPEVGGSTLLRLPKVQLAA